MPDPASAPQRRMRPLLRVVAASALVYPLLLRAVELVFAQLLVVHIGALVGWGSLGVLCSVSVVAAVRWGAARRVRSRWLLLGLAPPALYELWLCWPLLHR